MRRSFFVMLSVLGFCFARSQNITAAEYFFDADPGFGLGSPIDVASGQEVTLNFTVDLSPLSVGNHILFVRVKDDSGRWSLSTTRPFIKEAAGTTQNIVQAEYFFDADPGFGAGTPISPLTADSNVTSSFTVDLSGASVGLHVLFMRVKDAAGRWSLSTTRPFIKEAVGVIQDIVQAEYFFDVDPGFGQGTPITPLAAGSDVAPSFVVDLSAVNVGLHVLFIRVKDASGQWSLSITRPFIKEAVGTLQNIVQAEYFFDADPGFGGGTPVTPIAADSNVAASFVVDLSGVSIGLHVLFLRVKDAAGRWSISSTRPFLKEDVSAARLLSQAEYFFDLDPGFGSGTALPLNATDTMLQFTVGLDTVSTGLHVLFVRVQDETGGWSLSATRPFMKEAVLQPPPLSSIEYFFAKDTVVTAANAYSAFPPAQSIDVSFSADISALQIDSTYDIHLMVSDSLGRQSLQYVHSFTRRLEMLQPAQIDFGRQLVGARIDSIYSIVNFSEDTLWVSSVVSTSAEFIENLDALVILPGEARTDTISFIASAIGQRSAYIVIQSNSPTSPDSLVVKGFGHGIPALAASASSVDFGFVEVGSGKDSTISISNTGNDTLFVIAISSSNSVFVPRPVSLTVPPGASVSDTIRFAPSTVGADSGFIVLTSNSPGSPDTVAVRGTGNPPTGVEELAGMPTTYDLHQNYPNPFNPSTMIRYQLPQRSRVMLRVYNMLGSVVATLVQEEQDAGYYEIRWSPRAASGVYFLRLEAGEFLKTKKIILLR